MKHSASLKKCASKTQSNTLVSRNKWTRWGPLHVRVSTTRPAWSLTLIGRFWLQQPNLPTRRKTALKARVKDHLAQRLNAWINFLNYLEMSIFEFKIFCFNLFLWYHFYYFALNYNRCSVWNEEKNEVIDRLRGGVWNGSQHLFLNW